eukprot:GFUD01020377.1.p1 GENE.GFUD01020377.1~~GFUD01020377.1.p1  ORF type:complete len:144 (-),score=14.42 GFUD01020377.1:63-494(-)
MHTYKIEEIITVTTGGSDHLTVQNVLNAVRQELVSPFFHQIRGCEHFKKCLIDVLGNSFMSEVHTLGQSFLIRVWRCNDNGCLLRMQILIRAKYQEMVTLKDIAAYTVARYISKDDHVDCLEIPKSLYGDVRNHIGCTRLCLR